MAQTLEQLRAQDAWDCSGKAKEVMGKNYDKYVIVSKGLPALIMNSGLMQVLAFSNGKKNEDEAVNIQLRSWLSKRFPKVLPKSEFSDFMQALMKIDNAQDYQAINAEAFAWLKWLRQMAAARKGD